MDIIQKKGNAVQLMRIAGIISILILVLAATVGAVSAVESTGTDNQSGVVEEEAEVNTVDKFITAMNNSRVTSIVVKPSGDFDLEGDFDKWKSKIITKDVTFKKKSESNDISVKLGGVTIDSGVTVTIDSTCDYSFSVTAGKKLTISMSANLFFDNLNTELIKNLVVTKDYATNDAIVNVINNGTISFGKECKLDIIQDFVIKYFKDYGIEGMFKDVKNKGDDTYDVLIRLSSHSVYIEIPESDSILTMVDDGNENHPMPFDKEIDTYKIVGKGKFLINNTKEDNTLNIKSKVTISTDFEINNNSNTEYTIDIFPRGQLNVYGDMTGLDNVVLILEESKSGYHASFGYGGSEKLSTSFLGEYIYSLEFDYDSSINYILFNDDDKYTELKSGLQYHIAGINGPGEGDTATAISSSSSLTIYFDDTSEYEFELKKVGTTSSNSGNWYLYQEKMIPGMEYILEDKGSTFTILNTNAQQKVFWYQENTADVLTRDCVYQTKDGQYSFYVPEYGSLVLNKEDTPTGDYFHYLDDAKSVSDQKVIVSEPMLSLKNISRKVLYREGDDDEKETTVRIRNEVGLPMKLAFVKKGLNTFQSKIPGTDVDSEGDGVFTITLGKEADAELGIWTVYAHIQGLTSEAGNYAYVPVGDITIYPSKESESALISSMEPDSVDDGGVTEIFLEGTGGRKVYVTYYDADTETADDAVNMTSESKNLKFVANQANLVYEKVANDEEHEIGKYFVMPDSKQLTIGIKADTGVFSQKKYVILIKVEGCRVDLPGGDKNPLVAELTVSGNKFTAKLEKDQYTLGEDLKVSGTYNDTSDFGLSFYIEGTNVPMTKLHVPDMVDGMKGSDVRNGEYYYYLDSAYSGMEEEGVYSYNMSSWNPGIYMLYVSSLKNEYDDGKNDFTIKEKTAILEKATTLAVNFASSKISIESVPREVEAGFTASGDSRYMTVTVKAESADAISLYIIGQNKMFFINGKEALRYGYVKNLNSLDTTQSYAEAGEATKEDAGYNYLYMDDSSKSNKYWYSYIDVDGTHTPATDKSLSKILKNLGKENAFSETKNYPKFLIINNEDGTFTVYVHLAGSDENESKDNTDVDNQLDDGQYYLIVQNPMADKIFNTYAEKVEKERKTESYGYTSGVNVFTNNEFRFNVPALENVQAAQELMKSIESGGDTCAGKDFFVVSLPEGDVKWKEPLESYEQGEKVTMSVSGVDNKDLLATMELNQFSLTVSNVNVIQSFIPTKSGKESLTWTFTLDTKGMPLGSYDIIVRDEDNKVIKTFKTQIVEPVKEEKEESGEKELSTDLVIQGQDEVKVGESCSYTIDMSGRSKDDIEWKVSDSTLADIDNEGKFTAKSQGNVIITVTDLKTGLIGEKKVKIVRDADSESGGTEKTPSSPVPVLGILAGFGVAGVLLVRRR